MFLAVRNSAGHFLIRGINGSKREIRQALSSAPFAASKTANRLRKDCKSTALKLHSDCRRTAHSTFFKSETKPVKLELALHQAQSQSVPEDFAKYFCN